MLVRITKNGDVRTGEGLKMLFAGSVYDLPAETAKGLLESGGAEEMEPKRKPAGPPEDKAVRPRETKSKE